MVKVDITEKNFNFANGLSERNLTDMLVIHHTGENDIDATAEQIHEWHLNNGWAGIGYHFVIRKSGEIERGRPENAVGSHAYGENSHTLGIHLSGDFMTGKPTDAQIEKCAMLIANLAEKYNIPIDRNHIVGHCDLMSTDCPGTNLYSQLDTIIGKANWYRFGEEKQPATTAEIVNDKFNTIEQIPDWAKATIQKLIDKKYLSDANNLNLSLDMIRIFVVHDRAGLYA